ncbi:MAG: hypothetical protein A2383_02450 [Candidatus Pacebacteria bacterium RIFOXYB1_FULL_39_46]|nr:MAG: hypothetical protein A2383_02450 [Candidatus Pacebacteria bacterium RIFOXYB1_FULL_39_46]
MKWLLNRTLFSEMKQTKIVIQTLTTLTLIGIFFILLYGFIVLFPSHQREEQYLAIMQACQQRQLYMTREMTEAFNKLGETATFEEVSTMGNVLANTTDYFNTPGYYQECYTRTLEEWSLSD